MHVIIVYVYINRYIHIYIYFMCTNNYISIYIYIYNMFFHCVPVCLPLAVSFFLLSLCYLPITLLRIAESPIPYLSSILYHLLPICDFPFTYLRTSYLLPPCQPTFLLAYLHTYYIATRVPTYIPTYQSIYKQIYPLYGPSYRLRAAQI